METAVFPEPIMLLEQMLALKMRNMYGNLLSYYHYSEISIRFYVISVNVSKRKLVSHFGSVKVDCKPETLVTDTLIIFMIQLGMLV